MPRPNSAVASGRPAATTEPNVSSSTSVAIARPTISDEISPSCAFAISWPPSSIRRSAALACRGELDQRLAGAVRDRARQLGQRDPQHADRAVARELRVRGAGAAADALEPVRIAPPACRSAARRRPCRPRPAPARRRRRSRGCAPGSARAAARPPRATPSRGSSSRPTSRRPGRLPRTPRAGRRPRRRPRRGGGGTRDRRAARGGRGERETRGGPPGRAGHRVAARTIDSATLTRIGLFCQAFPRQSSYGSRPRTLLHSLASWVSTSAIRASPRSTGCSSSSGASPSASTRSCRRRRGCR